MTKNNYTDIMSLIYYNWRVFAVVISADDMLQAPEFTESSPEIDLLYQKFSAQMRELHGASPLPMLHTVQENLLFVTYPINEEYFCLIGPFSPVQVSDDDIFQIIHKYKVKNKKVVIPHLLTRDMYRMIITACFLFTGHLYTQEELSQHIFPRLKPDEELTLYQLDNELTERQHLSYNYETQWLDSIEHGIVLPYQTSVDNSASSESFVGLLAKDNPRKQVEYTYVAGITLASRAAMRGGVPPYEAYATSDVFLQQVAESKSIVEMDSVFMNALETISESVVREKKRMVQNPYVEHCKEYIGRHLHTPFTIQEMADSIGVSAAYLSRLFAKEVGMPIHQYIMDTRLIAGANMLRVAPSTIGEIAEYLCFCSPSHFGTNFQKKYDMTPSQYRLKYRVVNASDPILKI